MPRHDERPIVLTHTRTSAFVRSLLPSPPARGGRSSIKDSPRYRADGDAIMLTRSRRSTLRWIRRAPLGTVVLALAAIISLAVVALLTWLLAPAALGAYEFLAVALPEWVATLTQLIEAFPEWLFGLL